MMKVKGITETIITILSCLVSCFLIAQDVNTLKKKFSKIEFDFEEISGIGYEEGCTRRDPSDVIKVGDSYFVYYTKIPDAQPKYWGAGYWGASIWCAISQDAGYSWIEVGEVLKVDKQGQWDSHAVFTPNILYANGKYYLYYTGVKPTPGNINKEFENNNLSDITAIGVVVSDTPTGPFKRISEDPVLKVSVEPEMFDSYRVDDASLIRRNGLYWLYYKGRSLVSGHGGPSHTCMGVAFSKDPQGPFTKLGYPILDRSHEVLIWPEGTGVAAFASLSETFEYAPDGVDFMSDKLNVKVKERAVAPGAFRPDLTNPVVFGDGLKWGIAMVPNKHECYLIRYELTSR
ncbi:family 43 glycosylhydrolase [Aestuariibaculum sediminum]|uniref:Family 43 glycosylhydrolase n=1 Tax=Aestuariibaculum sediminum TaxID=2770637 RepID=A0A8J6Q7D0_9FLAO|nr:family 43 glycosylhydrolase [Aestuariibaculum sediminum]MBD0831620.1 family 43 glycosylhydrolase [Aestuariibaculum sediminum]